MNIDPELKRSLLVLARKTHNFVKGASLMIESQCGEEIKQAADQLAGEMVTKGVLTSDKRERTAQQLRFSKSATFDGMLKLAEHTQHFRTMVEAGQIGLGTPIDKSASAGGEDGSANDFWHSRMSQIAGSL